MESMDYSDIQCNHLIARKLNWEILILGSHNRYNSQYYELAFTLSHVEISNQNSNQSSATCIASIRFSLGKILNLRFASVI